MSAMSDMSATSTPNAAKEVGITVMPAAPTASVLERLNAQLRYAPPAPPVVAYRLPTNRHLVLPQPTQPTQPTAAIFMRQMPIPMHMTIAQRPTSHTRDPSLPHSGSTTPSMSYTMPTRHTPFAMTAPTTSALSYTMPTRHGPFATTAPTTSMAMAPFSGAPSALSFDSHGSSGARFCQPVYYHVKTRPPSSPAGTPTHFQQLQQQQQHQSMSHKTGASTGYGGYGRWGVVGPQTNDNFLAQSKAVRPPTYVTVPYTRPKRSFKSMSEVCVDSPDQSAEPTFTLLKELRHHINPCWLLTAQEAAQKSAAPPDAVPVTPVVAPAVVLAVVLENPACVAPAAEAENPVGVAAAGAAAEVKNREEGGVRHRWTTVRIVRPPGNSSLVGAIRPQDLYVVAADICLLMHIRKSNLTKIVRPIAACHRKVVRVPLSLLDTYKKTEANKTHRATVLSLFGVLELFRLVRSENKDTVKKWLLQSISHMCQVPPDKLAIMIHASGAVAIAVAKAKADAEANNTNTPTTADKKEPTTEIRQNPFYTHNANK